MTTKKDDYKVGLNIPEDQGTGNGNGNGKEKQSFIKTIKSYGPGIVVVLTWMGAGDLVDASVAGSHYGYSLMWVLALALIIRFVIVNIMARFELCNTENMTLLEAFSRLHKLYPYFFAFAAIIMGHLVNSYMIKGSGEVLAWIFNFGSPFMWSVFVVLISLFILGRNIYKKLELVMKILLAIMTAAFIGLAIYSQPDASEIVRGTIGFGLPEDTGAYGTLLVAMSLVGAVAGSLGNFLYGYFIKERGWIGPEHKKIQRNDLLFGICMGVVINLAVWVVGAEILKPNNIEVTSLNDIAMALELHLGTIGSTIFYLGAFGVLYSSVIGHAIGFPKISISCIQIIKNGREDKYAVKSEKDPLFKWISLFILVTPLIWSLPNMPGFVSLVVFVNVLYVIALPAISIGLLIISNKKAYLNNSTNNWMENIILAATTMLAIWSSIKLVIGFF
ncbi:Nramp family divalent metal transporter [Ureibacillus aquaedulcis]|uniref:Nramp family divalent metal transporter n=1 Tax=Ureibacillus aquaedulcis TaxID=3058421 RepID=A0ABT8GPB4_9BACL|nr:Nramp family divalent metal transporter [Ureibacillus sp. BA0131]MDN4493243.1 Nramp family divalent metal transporter [Ureibacillus sp. BA0131]